MTEGAESELRALNLLADLPRSATATDDEVLVFIEAEALHG